MPSSKRIAISIDGDAAGAVAAFEETGEAAQAAADAAKEAGESASAAAIAAANRAAKAAITAAQTAAAEQQAAADAYADGSEVAYDRAADAAQAAADRAQAAWERSAAATAAASAEAAAAQGSDAEEVTARAAEAAQALSDAAKEAWDAAALSAQRAAQLSVDAQTDATDAITAELGKQADAAEAAQARATEAAKVAGIEQQAAAEAYAAGATAEYDRAADAAAAAAAKAQAAWSDAQAASVRASAEAGDAEGTEAETAAARVAAAAASAAEATRAAWDSAAASADRAAAFTTVAADVEVADAKMTDFGSVAAGMFARLGSMTGMLPLVGEGFTNMAEKIEAADTESGAFMATMASVGKVATIAGLAGLAVVGAASVKMASDFQASMEMLHTNAGVAQSSIASLSHGVENLSSAVGFSPDELSVGLYHLASNGLRGADALNALQIAAEGAKNGNADLEDVTNALGAVIASKMVPGVRDYTDAMGILNATVGSGDMKMQDLADAMGTGMLATVKGFGVSLTDVGAALATFGDNNIRGAKAGTQLRMAVQAMADPISTGAAALQSLGLTTDTLAETMQKGGLKAAIDELAAHMAAAGYTGDKVGAILTDAFGKKAGTGINILTEQLDRFNGKFALITGSASKFGSDWTATQATVKQQTADLVAGIEALGTEFGSFLIPKLEEVVSVTEDVVAWFTRHKDIAEALAVVIGTVLGSAVTLFAVETMGKLIASFTTVFGALTRFGSLAVNAATQFAGIGEASMEASAAIANAGLEADAGFREFAVGSAGAASTVEVSSAEIGASVREAAAAADEAGAVGSAGFGLMLGGIGAAVAGAGVLMHVMDESAAHAKSAGQALAQDYIEKLTEMGKTSAEQVPLLQAQERAIISQTLHTNVMSLVTGKASGELATYANAIQQAKTQQEANDLATKTVAASTHAYSQQVAAAVPAQQQLTASLSEGAQVAQGELTNALDAVTKAASATSKSLSTLSDTMAIFTGDAAGVADAEEAVVQAFSSLTSAIKSNGSAFDGNTDKAINNRDALAGVASGIDTTVSAMAKQGASIATINSYWDQNVQRLGAQLEAAGLTTKQTEALMQQFGLTSQALSVYDSQAAQNVGQNAALESGLVNAANAAHEAAGQTTSLSEALHQIPSDTQATVTVTGLAQNITLADQLRAALLATEGNYSSTTTITTIRQELTHTEGGGSQPSSDSTEAGGVAAGLAGGMAAGHAWTDGFGKAIGAGAAGPTQAMTSLTSAMTSAAKTAIADLTRGIGESVSSLASYVADARSEIDKAFGGTALDSEVDHISEEFKALEANWDAITSKLKAAESALASIKQQAAQNAATLEGQDGIIPSGSGSTTVTTEKKGSSGGYGTTVTSTTTTTGAPVTKASLVAELKADVAAMRKYHNLLDTLHAWGLDETIMAQLVAAGPAAGMATAQALVSGGKKYVSYIDQLEGAIVWNAGKIGQLSAVATVDGKTVGESTAAGIVAGLQAEQKAITAELERIAEAMRRAIEQALGIQSPSTVFATIGGNIMAGLAQGITSSAHLASNAALDAIADLAGKSKEKAYMTGLSVSGGGYPSSATTVAGASFGRQATTPITYAPTYSPVLTGEISEATVDALEQMFAQHDEALIRALSRT